MGREGKSIHQNKNGETKAGKLETNICMIVSDEKFLEWKVDLIVNAGKTNGGHHNILEQAFDVLSMRNNRLRITDIS